MQKGLVIAEKDSLCSVIKEEYNKIKNELPFTLDFAVQSGHLVCLKEPEEYDEKFKVWSWDTLPLFPADEGGWKYKIIPATKNKFYNIKDKLQNNHYDFIVHAGDPDREGELLVHLVLRLLRCSLPVKRFWTNDIAPRSVDKELKNLHDDGDAKFQNLLRSAYCRSHFDWIFGMNMTRAASLAMQGTARCGRVKTPVLKIVVDREREIANFKPQKYYTITSDYIEGFSGILFNEDGDIQFKNKQDADNFIKKCLGKTAKVIKSVKEKKSSTAPSLYNLSTLQVDASKKFGFDPDETLSIVQSLYEKKYLSYPRTACVYLSSEMTNYFDKIIESITCVPEITKFTSQVDYDDIIKVSQNKKYINDKKIEEEGHTALIPTVEKPDWNSLSQKEKLIYETVAKRFLAIFLPPILYESAVIITDNNGNTFKTQGRIVLEKGYTELYNVNYKDNIIPDVNEGDIVNVKQISPIEKSTTCPKRYTSGDLISLMASPAKFLHNQGYKNIIKEIKGIGTEATRAEIIKELMKNGYIKEEKGKGKAKLVYATKTGIAIIDNLKDSDIVSVDLTAEWETKLKQIANGEKNSSEFDREVEKYIRKNIEFFKNTNVTSIKNTERTVGTCPICGKPLFESQKGWYCSGYKEGCNYFISKVICGKRLTDKQMASILQKGYSPVIKDFKSSKGDKFEAFIVFDKDYKIHFVRSFVCGKRLTESNLKQLLTKGKTNTIKGFVSKNGKNFNAKLILDNYNVKLDFSD